jgi:hypothetical protein
LLDKSSCLARTLGVTKFIVVITMDSVTLCCATYIGLSSSTNPTSEAGLLNKSSCLAATLGVTKFKNVRDMIFITLCCATLV